MTTATRNSAFVLLAALLLPGCASSRSGSDGWGHVHGLSGNGYWAGIEGEPERFYMNEHPSSSPIPNLPHRGAFGGPR